MGFRIGLPYTRFASMPQALWVALREDGHEVVRPEYLQIRTQACGVTGVRPRCLGRSSWCAEVGLIMVRAEPATRPEELRSAGEALLRTDRLGSRRRYWGKHGRGCR